MCKNQKIKYPIITKLFKICIRTNTSKEYRKMKAGTLLVQ